MQKVNNFRSFHPSHSYLVIGGARYSTVRCSVTLSLSRPPLCTKLRLRGSSTFARKAEWQRRMRRHVSAVLQESPTSIVLRQTVKLQFTIACLISSTHVAWTLVHITSGGLRPGPVSQWEYIMVDLLPPEAFSHYKFTAE